MPGDAPQPALLLDVALRWRGRSNRFGSEAEFSNSHGRTPKVALV